MTVVRMYDRLKPEKPGRPGHGQPEHPKKVIEELKEGYLTVHVPESICGDGKIVLDGRQMKPLPKRDMEISHLGSRRCLSGRGRKRASE